MLRRTFLGGTAAAAAAPFLPARPALAQGGRASVLRFVPQSDLTIVDPVTTTAYVTRNHALMVFDQLYGLDAQFTPQPQMVEGHTVEEDGRRWTFRLREGPGGPCSGLTRVRYTIEKGKFTEWRQLPDSPSGPVT